MRFGYVILHVPDVGAAVAFYEAAFGLARRFVHDGGDYAEMATGETVLAFAADSLVAANGLPAPPRDAAARGFGGELAFITEDVPAAFARALAAGAAPAVAPAAKPWGQVGGYVRDLNGVLVELCTPVGG
jgi:catechol 2,3-dioxygenase-like lactoylglutathione lyase family enzyme